MAAPDDTAGAPDPVVAVRTETSFDEFFLATHDRMVRALALAVGDDDLARDAAAEGFSRALGRWSTVATFDNPAGWVYRVGLNWSRSRWRRLRREVRGKIPEHPADDPPMADPALLDAVRQLSADHRDVVVGRYYLDWSEAQLASALDVAPGTVKSRLSRALDRLADLLEEDADGSN